MSTDHSYEVRADTEQIRCPVCGRLVKWSGNELGARKFLARCRQRLATHLLETCHD